MNSKPSPSERIFEVILLWWLIMALFIYVVLFCMEEDLDIQEYLHILSVLYFDFLLWALFACLTPMHRKK